MRYAPYDHEYQEVAGMTESQRLEYFLTRIFETEEIWGLDDGVEWIITEHADGKRMPVWPYRKFAEEAVADVGQGIYPDGLAPQAESLEVFLNTTLEILIEEDAMLDIMPGLETTECLISPQQLKSILEGMIDAGEYTLDG